MQLTVLGSGTVVADPARVCASYYVQAEAARILLDCGPGAVHAMARHAVEWSALTHIALTHFHTDHLGDLPFLFFALRYGLAVPRTQPLTVYGPAGTMERLRAMSDAFGSYMLHPGVRLSVHELGSGHEIEPVPGVRLAAHKTHHTEESIAYTVHAEGKRLAYTGDTGPDAELATWLAGSDTLLAECSLPEPLRFDMHLSPEWLADLARSARPGRLLVTHVYPQLERAAVPRLIREAGWDGPVFVVEDGSRWQI